MICKYGSKHTENLLNGPVHLHKGQLIRDEGPTGGKHAIKRSMIGVTDA